MTAYYNEIDPFAAQWLRELIKAGHIAPREVDERSIEDVIPSELVGFTQCHFFAGIGVWSQALRQAGWHDDRPVWTGSCPCQPFSAAGKGLGLADERNLWPAFEWLIRQCRPDTIFGEQVESAIKHDWLDHVALSLEDCGYTVGAIGFPACSVGAPHKRQRLFWVASSNSNNTGKLDASATALVFDMMTTDASEALDLWDYGEVLDIHKPLRFILGCSTVCAIRKDMKSHPEKMTSRYRGIVAVARLADPYCVWIR